MQTLFTPTCLLVGGAGRSGTTILGDVVGSHPKAAMLIEDSLTAIVQAVQMLASVRAVPEESDRAVLFGVPKSFINGPFERYRSELSNLSSMAGYRNRFTILFEKLLLSCCNRDNVTVFGSKSTIDRNWEDLPYLQSVLGDLRLLLIVRNPVNVVASSLRRRNNARLNRDVWHINSAEEALAEWFAAMGTMARIWSEQARPTLLVKYEDLCSDAAVAQDIYRFAGLAPFAGYPDLWRREIGDTRASLAPDEFDYLMDRLPDIDDLWARNSPQMLASRFGGLEH